jgi:hypothetical protein
MHKYRLYVYGAEDRLLAPPMVIAADNDEVATGQAAKMLHGVRTDLMDNDHLVMRAIFTGRGRREAAAICYES